MLKKIIYLFFVICLLIANFYIPSQVIAEESKTFGQVKKELADFKKQYEDNKLQQQLTEEERKQIKQNIKNTEQAIIDNQEEIVNLKMEIEKLNENIATKEKEIEDILTFYQISSGESAYLEYAFGAKTFTDFIYRTAISEQLTSYNNSLVEQYKKDIEESKKKTEELNLKIKQLEAKQVSLNEQLIKIGNDLEGLADDALTIETQIQLAEDLISTFTQMGCKDDETLEACAKNTIPLDTGFSRPLETGYVSGYTGWRCVLEYCDFHHGLDMSASGANYIDYPVYPIANGVVIAAYTAHVNGGRKVYIQHNINGKLYISAYWHLRRVDVEKGQVVTKNTQIGIMGGNESWDEWSRGTHLHLEISTSNFDVNSFYSYRSGWLQPEKEINLPPKYVTWYNRTTKY